MEITPANGIILNTFVQSTLWQAYGVTETWSQKFCTPVSAPTGYYMNAWIGMLNKLREWVGPRVVQTPAPQTYVRQVRNFEDTVAIDKWAVADDQYMVYAPTIQMLGYQMKKWPDYQVRDLWFDLGAYTGVDQIGVDGVTHWNTAHPIDFYDAAKGTYPNDYRGGVVVDGITVGGAFSANAFNTVYSDMVARVSEAGEKIGVKPSATLGPAELRASMAMVLNSQMFALPNLGAMGTGPVGTANGPFPGAMSNPLQGWTSIEIIEDFPDNSTWLMGDFGKPVKPFGWVLRQAPVMIPRINPADPAVFDTARFLWGVEARGLPVWANPFLSSISGPTAV